MPVMLDVRPFPVVKGKYLFWFAPAEEGGFTVTCQNLNGVNAQGETFEDALAQAVSMAAFVEECQAEIGRKKSSPKAGKVFGTPRRATKKTGK